MNSCNCNVYYLLFLRYFNWNVNKAISQNIDERTNDFSKRSKCMTIKQSTFYSSYTHKLAVSFVRFVWSSSKRKSVGRTYSYFVFRIRYTLYIQRKQQEKRRGTGRKKKKKRPSTCLVIFAKDLNMFLFWYSTSGKSYVFPSCIGNNQNPYWYDIWMRPFPFYVCLLRPLLYLYLTRLSYTRLRGLSLVHYIFI